MNRINPAKLIDDFLNNVNQLENSKEVITLLQFRLDRIHNRIPLGEELNEGEKIHHSASEQENTIDNEGGDDRHPENDSGDGI